MAGRHDARGDRGRAGAHEAVGAPPTWVLSNHDTVREVSRYARPQDGGPMRRLEDLAGLPGRLRSGPQASARGGAADAGASRRSVRLPGRGARAARGRGPARRGPAGSRLGDVGSHRPGPRRVPRADPVVGPGGRRSASARTALQRRRGCPSRPTWAALTVEAQTGDSGSMLELYRRALELRHARIRARRRDARVARRARRARWRSGAATRSRAWSTSPPSRWRRRRGRRPARQRAADRAGAVAAGQRRLVLARLASVAVSGPGRSGCGPSSGTPARPARSRPRRALRVPGRLEVAALDGPQEAVAVGQQPPGAPHPSRL